MSSPYYLLKDSAFVPRTFGLSIDTMHYMTTFTCTQACCTWPIGVRLHCMLGCPMGISSNGDGRSEKQRMDEG